MSTKPEVISQEHVVAQVKALLEQKDKLNTSIAQLEKRIDLVTNSLTENDHLFGRVQELNIESISLFEEEWKRKREYFPDLHLDSLEAILKIVLPPKPKTPTAAVAAPKKP